MRTELSEKIKALKKEGYSYNFIAKELGCSKGTVAYHCGTGIQERARLLRHEKRLTHAENIRTDREILKEFIFRYKRICGCKSCGEKDPIVLQFDHRDPTKKVANVSTMVANRVSLKRVKEEIKKCDVLCANCHVRKTAIQFNHHKKQLV